MSLAALLFFAAGALLWSTVLGRFDLSARRQIVLTAYLNFSLVVTESLPATHAQQSDRQHDAR